MAQSQNNRAIQGPAETNLQPEPRQVANDQFDVIPGQAQAFEIIGATAHRHKQHCNQRDKSTRQAGTIGLVFLHSGQFGFIKDILPAAD